MISDEAVEAAAMAGYEARTGLRWSALDSESREAEESAAQCALEAAAPYIRSQILEQAAAEIDEGVAAHGQEQYADWLRSRATDELTPRG